MTGSAFLMCMPVHARSLALLKGAPDAFSFTTPDGKAKRDRRCASCGSMVWSEIAAFHDVLALQAGALDDTRWLEPIAHIWTRSAQPWVEIPDHVLRFEQQPDDPLALVRAWKSRTRAVSAAT